MKYLQLVQTQQSLFAYISLDEITFFSSLNNSQQNWSYSVVFLFRSGETKNINACFTACLFYTCRQPWATRPSTGKRQKWQQQVHLRVENQRKRKVLQGTFYSNLTCWKGYIYIFQLKSSIGACIMKKFKLDLSFMMSQKTQS